MNWSSKSHLTKSWTSTLSNSIQPNFEWLSSELFSTPLLTKTQVSVEHTPQPGSSSLPYICLKFSIHTLLATFKPLLYSMALQSKSSFRVKNISEGHLTIMPDKNDWTRNKISLLKSQVFEFLWSWSIQRKQITSKRAMGRVTLVPL